MADFRRRHGAVFVLVAVVSLISLPAASGQPRATPSDLSTAQVAKKASPTVVTITTPSGVGSGVIIDAAGILVTNLHVIRGETQVSVRLTNGDVYDDVSVVDVDARKDLAVLRIKAFALTPASLGNSDDLVVGDRVVLIGSPRGLSQSVSDGLISAVRDSGEGYRLLQTSAAASPGSSGGGMFNLRGQLVGIVSSKLSSGENLNFAVPVNYVRGMAGQQSRMTLEELAAKFSQATATEAGAADVAPPTAKVDLAAAVRTSGLNLKQVDDSSWSITYRGDHLKTVTVDVSAVNDLVVTQSQVTADPIAHETLPKLLTLNFERDLVKVGIVDGTQLVALNETEGRLLDGPALKRIVLAVALFADDMAAVLRDSVPLTTASSLASSVSTNGSSPLVLLQGQGRLRLDRSAWLEEPSQEPGIQQFRNRTNDLWLRVIAERIEVPLDNLSDIVLKNIRETMPDVKVLKKAVRTVNGVRVLMLEFEGTSDGVPVSFLGHYYSGKAGTIHVIGWTGKNLMPEYRSNIENVVATLALTP